MVTGPQDDGRATGDVLEQGQGRWSAPSWWPSRGPSWWPPKLSRPAAIVSVVALVLGLGVGYLAGSRHTAGGSGGAAGGGPPAPPRPARAPAPPAPGAAAPPGGAPPPPASRASAAAQPASLGGPTLEQTSNECSAQHGT